MNRYNITIEPKPNKVSISIYDKYLDSVMSLEDAKVIDGIRFITKNATLKESTVFCKRIDSIHYLFKSEEKIKQKITKFINANTKRLGKPDVLKKYTDPELKADVIKELTEFSKEIHCKFVEQLIYDTLKEKVMQFNFCDEDINEYLYKKDSNTLNEYYILKSNKI